MKKIILCLVIFGLTVFNIHAQLDIQDTIMLAHKNDVYWGSSSELELEGYADYGKYGSTNLSDNDPATCWAEGSESNGIGEYIWMSIPQNTNQLKIRNGFQKSESLYLANNRPKTIKIDLLACFMPPGYVTETHIGFAISKTMANDTIILEDKLGFQDVLFDFNWSEIKNQVTEDKVFDKDRFILKITIEDIYRGNKWNDACISDIEGIPDEVYEITLDEHGLTKISDNKTDTLFYDPENIYQIIDLTDELEWIIFILMPANIGDSRAETIYKLYNTQKEGFIETKNIFQMYSFVETDDKLYLNGMNNDFEEINILLEDLKQALKE